MTTSELENRNIAITMRKSVENLVISSQDAIGQSISQALTFSGVITQHTNNILHENRSVSRSPSPSPSATLRTTDNAIDALDNDKISEISINAAIHGGGDTASISSGEIPVTIVSASPPYQKSENHKLSSNNTNMKASDTGGGGGSRIKKKSWYNSLYPTYKSKSEDFKRLFKDLPDDERLIVDYSCAIQKDILCHGRLYASQNYLCFYASIFGWETNLMLRWKDVTAITKEKTALVIPNAILVCTEGEKYFLASFSGRDKAYLMLFRVWQNALMDQPMTSHEIWQWVHSCYGEELGFNSDEEGYNREPPDDAPSLPPDSITDDLVDSACMETSGGDSRDESRSSRPPVANRDSSPPLVNGDASYREVEGGDTLPTDMSDTSDSEPEKPHNGCDIDACTSPHEGKLLLRQEFPFNIDQMFTMIFTNSKFNLELLAARGTTDYVQAPWAAVGGRKCRQLSYTLQLTSGPIGPKEVRVTETQVMNKCSKPGQLYSIESTSDNAGIPYADYFSVGVHYCLRRTGESGTDLAFYAGVKYKKSMWQMTKTFLEKNTMGGVEEFVRMLELKLTAEADSTAPTARKSGRRQRRQNVPPPECTAPSIPSTTLVAPRPALVVAGPRVPPRPPARPPAWLLLLLSLLLLLNAVLYWRLYRAERPGLDLDALQNRLDMMSGASGRTQWAELLERHSATQRTQLAQWRHALDATRAHLAQTEQALKKLLETIKPSLDKSQGHEPPDEL